MAGTTICLKLEEIDLSYSAGIDCGGPHIVRIRRPGPDIRAAFARATRKLVTSGVLAVRGNPHTITLHRIRGGSSERTKGGKKK
jgi:hypothetical protein